jgi:RHS repeat-associated protein
VPNAAVPTPGRTAILDQITLGLGGGSRDYSFGSAGHLDEIVSGALTSTYQHSPEGQLVDIATVGARSTLTYDGRGFLRRAEKPAFSIFEDGFETGNLDCWSTGGPGCFTPTTEVTTTATYGSEGLLYALQRHTGERHHVLHFAGRPVAQLRVPTAGAAAFTYLTTDHLGTPVLAMNQAGATLWRGGFDPFGNDWNGTAGAAGVFLRFPGQWEDGTWSGVGTAGLSYNLHRWYERGTGRYERSDPYHGREEHPFSYVESNPFSATDLLGLFKTQVYKVPSDNIRRYCDKDGALGCFKIDFTFDCRCSCDGSQWKPSVVFYVAGPARIFVGEDCYDPERTIREELRHASAYERSVPRAEKFVEQFRQTRFSTEAECQRACTGFLEDLRSVVRPPIVHYFIDFTHPARKCDGSIKW